MNGYDISYAYLKIGKKTIFFGILFAVTIRMSFRNKALVMEKQVPLPSHVELLFNPSGSQELPAENNRVF